MRKVETSAGPLDVRPLTRKEIRGGRDFGLRYFGLPEIDKRYEDVRDYCIACLYGEESLDDISNVDQNAIFSAIIAETWSSPGEEKNLPTSGPGAQTGDA